MSQFYFDPSRESDPHALPDGEVFYAVDGELVPGDVQEPPSEAGWYYWSCFPGCLPDSDPIGPFKSKAAALDDAREQS